MRESDIYILVVFAITLIGVGVSLFKVHKSSVRRSVEAAEHNTSLRVKIMEVEKDIIEMRSQREKDMLAFAELIEKIEGRQEAALLALRNANRDDHKELFKLHREQAAELSAVAAGVSRIVGFIDAKK